MQWRRWDGEESLDAYRVLVLTRYEVKDALRLCGITSNRQLKEAAKELGACNVVIVGGVALALSKPIPVTNAAPRA